MSSSKHYLIVGAGLAGISLAWHLRKRGHRLTLIDNGKNKSSVIAAGMINPIVFRRMTKSWRADEFIPYAYAFYKELEAELGVNFFHPITIRRIFSSEQERGFWEERQNDSEFEQYITPITADDTHYLGGHNPYGTGRVKNASYIETQNFIHNVRNFFTQNCTVLSESFEHSAFDPKRPNYRGVSYDGVVFCEGFCAPENPLFNHLPVQQTKGETITIYCPDLKTNESLNRKCFILPLGKDLYRIGATYVWNTPTDELTSAAKEELSEKFRVISDLPFEMVDQKAGIRPTTPDRRPLIGEHADYSNIYIFNGLGTKGYMSAPLLSKELCDHILNGSALSEEVLITRFKKR